MPAGKRYIVYPEKIQGRGKVNVDMRRQTRMWRSEHWGISIGGKPSVNSNKSHGGGVGRGEFRWINFSRKTEGAFRKRFRGEIKCRGIRSLKGSRAKWHREAEKRWCLAP